MRIRNFSMVDAVAGRFRLAFAKPGVDEAALNATDFDDLHFHSDWLFTGGIIQTGTEASVMRRGDRPAADRFGYTCEVTFPDPGFVPMVTVDRVEQAGSKSNTTFENAPELGSLTWSHGDLGHAEDWRKINTNGSDPYIKGTIVHGARDRFYIKLDELATISDAVIRFNYIVWNFPAVLPVT